MYIKLQNCCVSFFEVYFEGGTPKIYTNQLRDVCNEVHFLTKNTFFTEHLWWLLLKRLSKEVVSLELTIFTKNFILDV